MTDRPDYTRHGDVRRPSSDTRADLSRLATNLRAVRDVDLALHVAVVGDDIAPFMTSVRDTDPAALREADSRAILPDDPAAATEEIQRRVSARPRRHERYPIISEGGSVPDHPAMTALAGD